MRIKKVLSVVTTVVNGDDNHSILAAIVKDALAEGTFSPVDSVTITYKNGDYLTYEYEEDET